MSDASAVLFGQCRPWPSKEALVRLLEAAGLRVSQGRFSVRVGDCSHFVFQHLGGDVSAPTIDADADTPYLLMRDAQLVSSALAAAGVKHRFEIYDRYDELVACLHHDWPSDASD